MKKIKVGIWGLGRAGNLMHISEIAKFPEMFAIVAGCDNDNDRIKAAKEKLPSCRFYGNPEEFLKDPEVELVSIATRSPDHTPHAIRALAAGKYVFLEKPIALSYAEARKLKKASEKHPGKLYLRHNRRYEAPFNHIREIIASGILGDVYEVKLHRHGYRAGMTGRQSSDAEADNSTTGGRTSLTMRCVSWNPRSPKSGAI